MTAEAPDLQFFRRAEQAARIAQQVLRQAPISSAPSGVFLAAPRRTGKTTFLRHDLTPVLEGMGACVIYVDLWADRTADPGDVIVEAIRAELARHAGVVPRLAQILGVSSAKVGGVEFSLDRIGLGRDVSLVRALAALSDEVATPIVLLIDEAQHASTTEQGNDALFSLKAARDELNNKHHGLRVVCTGSNRNKLSVLRMSKDQAFYGAPLIDFQPLGMPYIEWFCKNTADLPRPLSPDRVFPLFQKTGNRPEMLAAAVDQMRFEDITPEAVDDRLEALVLEHHEQANKDLLRVFYSLSPAQAAVLRVLAAEGENFAPYEEKRVEKYRRFVGKSSEGDFSDSAIQRALSGLQEKNLIWRASRGVYAMEDDGLVELLRDAGELDGLG